MAKHSPGEHSEGVQMHARLLVKGKQNQRGDKDVFLSSPDLRAARSPSWCLGEAPGPCEGAGRTGEERLSFEAWGLGRSWKVGRWPRPRCCGLWRWKG